MKLHFFDKLLFSSDGWLLSVSKRSLITTSKSKSSKSKVVYLEFILASAVPVFFVDMHKSYLRKIFLHNAL